MPGAHLRAWTSTPGPAISSILDTTRRVSIPGPRKIMHFFGCCHPEPIPLNLNFPGHIQLEPTSPTSPRDSARLLFMWAQVLPTMISADTHVSPHAATSKHFGSSDSRKGRSFQAWEIVWFSHMKTAEQVPVQHLKQTMYTDHKPKMCHPYASYCWSGHQIVL